MHSNLYYFKGPIQSIIDIWWWRGGGGGGVGALLNLLKLDSPFLPPPRHYNKIKNAEKIFLQIFMGIIFLQP